MAETSKSRQEARIENLTALLSQKGLVHTAPSKAELDARIEKCRQENRPLRILYGETFDDKGNTLDSMKYYLFTSLLAKEIKEKYGVEVEPVVLVADLGVYRNEPDRIEEFKAYAEKRKEFANMVKDTYGCEYEVKLLSEISSTEDFKLRFNKAVELGKSDEALMGMIKETVPEDRREASAKIGYAYAFEEIATILGIDIKVGPPRENLYDRTANAMLEHFNVDPLMPVYLMPSYPLGASYESYINSPIRQYGLTPYKAGSAGMMSNRIRIGRTLSSDAERLIDNTEISVDTSKPNPVLDVMLTADMARQHIQSSLDQGYATSLVSGYLDGKIEADDLKAKTYFALQKYVLSILPDTRNMPDNADISNRPESGWPWGNYVPSRSEHSLGISEIEEGSKEFFKDKTFLFERGLINRPDGLRQHSRKDKQQEGLHNNNRDGPLWGATLRPQSGHRHL